MVDLSIIIVTWNTKELTLNCIQSIYKNTPTDNFSYEIILVDNASSDGTLKEIKKRFPMVCVIENPENLGFAKANNIGITRANAPLVLLLNSDTLIKDDAIYNTAIFLKEQNSNVGAVTCKVLYFDGSLQIHCRQFYTKWNIAKRACGKLCFFLPNLLRGQLNIDFWQHNTIKTVEWVHMSFLMIRKPVLEEIGSLDERFYFYGEDMEFCYRLHKNGYKILFLNTAEIFHKCGGSSVKPSGKRKSEVINALFVFYDKYGMIMEKNLMRIWFGIKNKLLTLTANRTK